MLKKFLKNEKGSITLFILLSILFFLIVIFSIFMVSGNKKQAQTSEIDKIKKEYEQSIDNIDQIYDETLTENLSNLLHIGTYVNYAYDIPSENYTISSTESGYNQEQIIKQRTDLKWRILNINKTDGTVDLISELPTSKRIYFNGALGYNNSVLLINDICAKHYSNTALGITARSINIEDIENQLSDEGIRAKNSYNNGLTSYGDTQTYGDGYNIYPLLYAKENGSGIDTTATKVDGIGPSENGYLSPTKETSSTAINGLTVTQDYYFENTPSSYFNDTMAYKMLFETNSYYWIASRSVNTLETTARFGLKMIVNSTLDHCAMLDSQGNANNTEYISAYLRPIVSIDITQIQPCTGIADGSDKTIEHMHQIKKK